MQTKIKLEYVLFCANTTDRFMHRVWRGITPYLDSASPHREGRVQALTHPD